MHNEQTLRLLQEVASGSVTPEDALLSLRMEPFEKLFDW